MRHCINGYKMHVCEICYGLKQRLDVPLQVDSQSEVGATNPTREPHIFLSVATPGTTCPCRTPAQTSGELALCILHQRVHPLSYPDRFARTSLIHTYQANFLKLTDNPTKIIDNGGHNKIVFWQWRTIARCKWRHWGERTGICTDISMKCFQNVATDTSMEPVNTSIEPVCYNDGGNNCLWRSKFSVSNFSMCSCCFSMTCL